MIKYYYRPLVPAALMGLLLILLCQNAYGDQHCIITELNKTFGGTLDDEGHFIQQTSDGGYIFTGRTSSNGANNYDLFLTKTDPDGNIIWDKTFGGLKDDEGYSVEQTADGGYILIGKTKSSGSGMYDVLVIKVDQNGNMIWDKIFGGPLDDEGYSVRQTSDSGYILVGKTKSSGSGMYDVLVLKVDQNGNMVWDKAFGGPLDDMGDSVLQTSDGGYIIAGTTSSFGAGEADAWLIKTDQDGNKIWDNTFGGPKSELNPWSSGWYVRENDNGEFLLVGSTNSIGSGGYDAWFIKTDPNGNPIIDKAFGGPLDDEGDSIIQTGASEYVLLGSTSSQGSGGYDAWLIKIDRNGNKIWDQTFGGKVDDKGYSIQQTSDDGYVFVGKTRSNSPLKPRANACCDNVPGISSNFDIWLVKIKSGLPTIDVQPAGIIACEGQEASLAVEASGTQPLTYQWMKDGFEISGANANTYSIPIVSADDAGSYSVMVKNDCGLIESDQATLQVNFKPSILSQPVSQSVCEGSPAIFTVEVTGSMPLAFQWMKDGMEIPGATSNSYSIPSATADDMGTYTAAVSNSCGQIESEAAALTLYVRPSILVQPVSQTVCEGSPVTFGVEATETEPLAYQWMKDGEVIAGATSSSYSIPMATAADTGTYIASVSNSCGQIESEMATLNINVRPSILVHPQSMETMDNSSVTFSIEAAGSEPLTYQWKKNGEIITGADTNTYYIARANENDAGSYSAVVSNTCGFAESDLATLMVYSMPVIDIQPVYEEVCEGSEVAFNVEATGTEPLSYQWKRDGENITGANENTYRIPIVSMDDAGSYGAIVSNCCGTVESIIAELAVNPKSSIQIQPADQVVCEGSEASFSIQATGTEPLAYQWKKNGENITGASSSVYSIPVVSASDAGDYSVIVSSCCCGWIESNPASLIVITKPSILVQPVSQSNCEGAEVSFSVEAIGSEPFSYQWMKDGAEILGENAGVYSISNTAINDSGGYSAVVSNCCGLTISNVAALTIGAKPSIVVQPVSQMVCEGAPVTFGVEATGTEPLAFQWMKDGLIIDNATASSFSIPNATTNDIGTYSVTVSNSCGQIESEAAALVLNVKPSIVAQPTSQTVCEGSSVTFGVEATGTEPLAFQWMRDGRVIDNATADSYSISSTTAGDIGTYSVAVSNSCGQIESEVATLALNVKPSILVQPVSQTVCDGAPVTFAVEATGTEPLAYQWMKDGRVIDNATANSYSIPIAAVADIGSYAVTVSNSCGQIDSEVATVALYVGPSIIVQPASQTVCEGSSVMFSVEATGTEPLAFQWMKDGLIIDNATASSFSIPNATTNDIGTYSVTVSNSCGQIESEAAALVLNVKPSIVAQPVPQTICEGLPVIFSVEATGTEPLEFQWMKDGLVIDNATDSSYSIPIATAGDIGTYSVMVSNSCGQIDSEVATLALNVRPTIMVQPVSQTVCEGSPVMFSVEAIGTEPLEFQWMKDGVEIPGANEDIYHINCATPTDSGCYSVRVSNECNQIQSEAATLAVCERPAIKNKSMKKECPSPGLAIAGEPPAIALQPLSQTACEGSAVTLSVEGEGAWPMYYQWMKDNVIIPGANSKKYTIFNISPEQSGEYKAIVSNCYGSVESNAATLWVEKAPIGAIVRPSCQIVSPAVVSYSCCSIKRN